MKFAPRDSNHHFDLAPELEALAADHWIVGRFDAQSRLIGSLVSDNAITQRVAYDMLFSWDENTAPGVFSATATEEKRGTVKVLAIYDPANMRAAPPDTPGLLAGIAAHALAEKDARFGDAPALDAVALRQWSQVAMFEVDTLLRIGVSWLSRESTAAELVDLVKSVDGRLPVYARESVRAIVADWDWSDSKRCREGAFAPVPEILVRVVPAATDGGTKAFVIFEALQARQVLRKARDYYGISRREVQVLDFLLEGYTVGEIATALVLAESTVQDHVKHVIVKTGANNRVQMAARILGWTSRTKPVVPQNPLKL